MSVLAVTVAGMGWDPWREADERSAEVFVESMDGGAGYVEVDPDGREVIVLADSLRPDEARVVLTHELIHLIRG